LEAQAAWRDRMEAEPVRFLARELEGHLDDARAGLAQFVGARPNDVVFVRNATTAINAVLASLRLERGDEILVSDHEYNAIVNAARRWSEPNGARVRVARVPLGPTAPGEVVDDVLSSITERTRLAIVSHVTSPTALVMPIAEIAAAVRARGVAVLVDGAHAPGMVDLNVDRLGVD